MKVTLRGSVFEVDQALMTFKLQPVYGEKVAGPIPEKHYDTILEAFNGYRKGIRVLVQGVGRYDRQSRLSGLDSVEQFSLLDPLDVPARLDEFRDMQDGWLEGNGLAPSHTGLDWLADSFDKYYPPDVPRPYLYPTSEGGIEAEWSLGTRAVICEINLDTHHGDWLQFDRQSDAEDSRNLNLTDTGSWEWLAAEIRRLTEAAE